MNYKISNKYNRRHAMNLILHATLGGAAMAATVSSGFIRSSFAANEMVSELEGGLPDVLEITWDDLIPAGVEYPQIIADGDLNLEEDTWKPIFDANAQRFNDNLNGELVRIPGFVVPLETGQDGITTFILVPYYGACIHTPPPPPNQLVMVNTAIPWEDDSFFGAVWVTGQLRIESHSTELADTGYEIVATEILEYELF